MLHSEITVVKFFCATFSWLWFFASCLHYCDKKCDNWECNSRPYDCETFALPTAPLSLSPFWCISEGIGTLYVDAAFRNNTVVDYLLCCFWLALVFPLLPVLLWQKVRQVRIELTTLRLWDLHAAICVIVAVFFMVHQWKHWSLVRWCGVPE